MAYFLKTKQKMMTNSRKLFLTSAMKNKKN